MRKRFETLWAIRPEAALTVVRLMAREENGSAAAIGTGKVQIVGTQWVAAAPFSRGTGTSKVSVIPIQGVLTNDGPAYYGSNYKGIADAVEKATADPDVRRIILSVDSPGGEVTGLPETAAVIAAAAKVKPVSAIVEGAAASAAYWLTSQASTITLTPSGEVGSVGVRMMHMDMSKMLDNEGYRVTELFSGEYKTEWSPYHPLTDEAKADMQTRLDASHREFLSAVASGRNGRASAVAVRSKFGGGRMFSSGDALKMGLVDRVQPARDFYHAGPSPAIAPAVSSSVRRARIDLERARVS